MPKKAIFLDADGVLNKAILKDGKPMAPTTLAQLEIPDEVKPALSRLKAAGYLLICVTNKPDIEHGLMTQTAVDAIYDKLRHWMIFLFVILKQVIVINQNQDDYWLQQKNTILSWYRVT